MDFKYEIVEAKPIPVISIRKRTTVENFLLSLERPMEV